MAEPNPAKRKRANEEGEQKAQPLVSLDFEGFAPEGDVIFIVQGETRVRVHCVIIRHASPVFYTMLGPNFREGHTLANAGGTPVEVALPEDDAEVFGWDPIPATLLKICILVDKYDMKESLSLSLCHWLWQAFGADLKLEDVWLVALAGLHLQYEPMFHASTEKLILSAQLPFVELAICMEEWAMDFVSSRVIYRFSVLQKVTVPNMW
ncbi:hypothetical protein FGRMN_4667 [Fusarium graminum]|nr:hypothetical protein FGRMN_4667 [Fusarium graminum]